MKQAIHMSLMIWHAKEHNSHFRAPNVTQRHNYKILIDKVCESVVSSECMCVLAGALALGTFIWYTANYITVAYFIRLAGIITMCHCHTVVSVKFSAFLLYVFSTMNDYIQFIIFICFCVAWKENHAGRCSTIFIYMYIYLSDRQNDKKSTI